MGLAPWRLRILHSPRRLKRRSQAQAEPQATEEAVQDAPVLDTPAQAEAAAQGEETPQITIIVTGTPGERDRTVASTVPSRSM